MSSDAPLPELPAEHRWTCSSNVKSRIASIFDYYLHRLKSNAIDPEVADMFAGDWRPAPPAAAAAGAGASGTVANTGDDGADATEDNSGNPAEDSAAPRPAITPDDFRKLALAMAKKSFEANPMFLLPDEDPEPLPTHCIRLDVLSAPKLLKAVRANDVSAVEAQLVSGTSSAATTIFAFADSASCASGDIGADRDTIVEIFEQLPRLPNCSMGQTWSGIVVRLLDQFQIMSDAHNKSASDGAAGDASPGSNTHQQQEHGSFRLSDTTYMFDALPLSNMVLFERCLACLFLSIPALTTEACLRVCSAVTLAGGLYREELTGKQRAAASKALLVRDDSTLLRMLGRLSPKSMRALVGALQNSFTMSMFQPGQSQHRSMAVFASALSLLHRANTSVRSRGIISHKEYYNPEANSFNEEELLQDFNGWLRNRNDPFFFSFSRYPCLCDPRLKSKILQFTAIAEAQAAHQQAMNAALQALFLGGRNAAQRAQEEQWCVFNIRRDNLVQSTLNEVNAKGSRLRRPLRVNFVGEEGIDAGGVTKEFFQLILKELLTPSYGMFCEMSRTLWFSADVAAQNMDREFFLIGSILGLAVFNNVICDLHFPKVTYRKLLGIEPDLEDLREIDPDLVSGLEKMLAWDEEREGSTVEDVFDRCFVYEHNVYGSVVEVELVPGGKNMQLTAANRKRYVNALVQYLLVGGVARNFEAFKRGFMSVAAREMIHTMAPEEMESLLCGDPVLDINELESSCRYEGYEKTDDIIQWFWRVLRGFTEQEQRKFLHFCTGSDRVPVGGLKELRFVIGKNGEGDEALPTASTCFNQFLLPLFSSEKVLRDKLLLAIENAEGFGLK